MTIRESQIMGGMHLVILGAGASIASSFRDPEALQKALQKELQKALQKELQIKCLPKPPREY